jgi:hypothetical protein
MLQDDVLLHGSSDLCRYLESFLWPTEPPAVLSLYCPQVLAQEQSGWHRHAEPWFVGAPALVFSPEAAGRFVTDREVLDHRLSPGQKGLTGIDTQIGQWAHRHKIPIHYPTPSLCKHIGVTSSLWVGSAESPARRNGPFSEDVGNRSQPANAGFPESYFPCAPSREDEHRRRTALGLSRMHTSSVVVCGLARDVAPLLPLQIERIEKLGKMFDRYQVVIYENDSVDETRDLLRKWSLANRNVHLLLERLGAIRYPQIRSIERAERMAYYRNKCREHVLSNFPDYSYVIVLDTDLEGGWSYDGVASTFGHHEWDYVGSNGLLHRRSPTRISPEDALHFDCWAFRRVGHDEPHPNDEINALRLLRGEPLQPVWSCFGGLGIYRMECLKSAQYSGEDCEHVCLHRQMRKAGFTRLFLNPSQITLYDRV